jgi:hypothetical protein
MECENCGKKFRDRWNLSVHQSRLRPCTKNLEKNEHDTLPPNLAEFHVLEQNSTLAEQNSMFLEQNSTLAEQNSMFENDTIKCQFCFNTYFNKACKQRHEKNCKQKNDTRLLEIELDITPILPTCKTECRFCNKILSRTDTLNKHVVICKERFKYNEKLLKQRKEIGTQIINGENVNVNCNVTNNNNNTINNNTINHLVLNFGEETMEHIELRDIIKILKEAKDEYREDEFSKIAGEFVCLFDKLIKENPKNKNITIPCLNSMYAKVKYSHGWETMPIDKVVHRLIKNTSRRVLEQRKEIEEYDRRNNIIGTMEGSRLRITPHVFNEVNVLNTNGINELEPVIRTSLKLNNFIE